MGRRPKQTYFKRRHTDSQQAHEKMLTLLMIREMQIKTKVSYHFTCVRMTMIKKNTNNKYWQECGAMGTLVHFWWECELVQPGCKTVWRFLKKLKIEHMIQQFNPGVYPKHPKTVI